MPLVFRCVGCRHILFYALDIPEHIIGSIGLLDLVRKKQCGSCPRCGKRLSDTIDEDRIKVRQIRSQIITIDDENIALKEAPKLLAKPKFYIIFRTVSTASLRIHGQFRLHFVTFI